MDTPAGKPVSFEVDVKPLFRERDHKSMLQAFDLWSYDDVRGRSSAILAAVANGSMPCDLTWPAEDVAVLRTWIDTGFAE